MNRIMGSILLLAAVMTVSCRKEATSYVLDNYILAGQKEGTGVEYIDIEPDIIFTIDDPWERTDTTIRLDLDKDGTIDFELSGAVCHPSMLGADCESAWAIPLPGNEVCICPGSDQADTIPDSDTIHAQTAWSGTDALLYSYFWMINSGSETTGCWHSVYEAGTYFLGVRFLKENKIHYGWIGLKGGRGSGTFNFRITDYAYTREHPE